MASEQLTLVPVRELRGIELDWAVAWVLGLTKPRKDDYGFETADVVIVDSGLKLTVGGWRVWNPSSNHGLAGTIIAEARIGMMPFSDLWQAITPDGQTFTGKNWAEVGMLAFVVTKAGKEFIELPDNLPKRK